MIKRSFLFGRNICAILKNRDTLISLFLTFIEHGFILSQATGDPQNLLRCLRDVSLSELESVPVKGLEFAPAFGPSIDGVVIDPGDPEDQDYTLQVDTINTLNNILLRKDVVAKLSRYHSTFLFVSIVITREIELRDKGK